jgi:hypothetical protein
MTVKETFPRRYYLYSNPSKFLNKRENPSDTKSRSSFHLITVQKIIVVYHWTTDSPDHLFLSLLEIMGTPNSWTYNFVEFLGILRVLRLEVSVYNVYITNQFPAIFAQEGGRLNQSVEVTVNSRRATLKTFVPITSKNSTSGKAAGWATLANDEFWARIFKRLRSPGIDSKEWIPLAYVAWRAGTIILFLLGS